MTDALTDASTDMSYDAHGKIIDIWGGQGPQLPRGAPLQVTLRWFGLLRGFESEVNGVHPS